MEIEVRAEAEDIGIIAVSPGIADQEKPDLQVYGLHAAG